jgi:predicted TPR repeat methyltransferase
VSLPQRVLVGRAARAAGALLLLWALAGCATPESQRLLEDAGGLPPRAEVTGVPFFPQEEAYCGPAALATVLSWSGLPVTQDEIAAQVYTPGREGTLRTDITAAARRHGRLAVPVTRLADLAAELAEGHPVLMFQNLGLGWFPVWHYAVAVGYDLQAGDIVLRSGLEPRRVTSLPTFERTWARGDHWALVVLPPDQLPAAADELAVLRAASGLEQAGRPQAAATAYAAIAERWPDSLAGWIGLGNTAYTSQDLAAAEAAFRNATERHPEAAAAWNNLAHVLGEQGRRAEAIAAAEQAVRLGGPDAATYRATLREVGGAGPDRRDASSN